MPTQFMRAALIALFATTASFAAAQESDNGGGESSVGGGLDLGESVPNQAPQPYVKATYGDWELQCLATADGGELCQMLQLLTDGAGGNVAEANVFRLAEGGQAVAGGTFIVPLETLLTEKLTLTIDGENPKRYDFAFCNPVGCIARVGFTQDDIDRMKAGAVAQVAIVPALAPDQRVVVDMSLTGFTAAYDQVSVARQ